MPEITVDVSMDTLIGLKDAAEEQGMTIGDYASGLLKEAGEGKWVSVYALMEMGAEIRRKHD